MNISYVVACWFGDRKHPQECESIDELWYIKQHIKALNGLKHGIRHAMFVFNCDANDMGVSPHDKLIYEAMELVDKHCKVPSTGMRRDNFGISYGAWDAAIRNLGREYDYHFLVEDDYVPVLDNFDEVHLEYMKKDPKNFYICGMDSVHFQPQKRRHASISNGMLCNKAYWNIYDKCGKETPTTAGWQPKSSFCFQENGESLVWTLIQERYLDYFLDNGYLLDDVLGEGDTEHRTVFHARPGYEHVIHGNPTGTDIILPITGTMTWEALRSERSQ